MPPCIAQFTPLASLCTCSLSTPATLTHRLPVPLPLPCSPRYENCEMRTVVLADEGGAYGHPCRTHFHGGHAVKTADT